MYAVVKAGGSQHKVAVGDTFTINRLAGAAGDSVALPAILLVDAATNRPVSLDYGLRTQRTADQNGVITGVTLPIKGQNVPSQVRAYLMIDTSRTQMSPLTIP